MKFPFNFLRAPHAELPANEIRELTTQFYVTLEACFAKVKGVVPPPSQDAYDRVSQLLEKEPRTWSNAYAIEQLLVHLFDDDTLATELSVRVREAKGALKPALADYYAADEAKTTLSVVQRRALLSRLINDLQWRYTVDEVKRGYTKEITLKTGEMFIMSMLLFAASVLLALKFPDLMKFDLRMLLPAVLAGCWGASFSMLGSLRDRLEASNLDALKVLRQRWVLGSRVLIGAGGASLLYFFFVSGLIMGPAFPDLKGTSMVPASPKQQATAGPQAASSPQTAPATEDPTLKVFALLVVWCFIAGFSERLIPSLLARTESKLDTPSTTDRYRPAATESAPTTPKPAPGTPPV